MERVYSGHRLFKAFRSNGQTTEAVEEHLVKALVVVLRQAERWGTSVTNGDVQ